MEGVSLNNGFVDGDQENDTTSDIILKITLSPALFVFGFF
jgi:hypothetical protein